MGRNDGFDYEVQLGAEADGCKLEVYLADRYRHSSAEEWRARIRSGRVLLDSQPAAPDDRLRQGQRLVWRRPPWDEPDAPRSFAVLFEDEELIAVAKPPGLPTLPGAGFVRSTLLHLVREYAPDASPLHRLGRWTSGVVLFARSRRARKELTRQWAEREVRKRYRALAAGSPERDRFEVAIPIGPVPHPLLGTVHAASPAGKPASSVVEVLERRRAAFLCAVEIRTGRPHQIRIHLAAAGHPLVGDPLYGAGGVPPEGCRALPGDPGYSLHAESLSFRHPQSRRELTVTCTPPLELRTRDTTGEFDPDSLLPSGPRSE